MSTNRTCLFLGDCKGFNEDNDDCSWCIYFRGERKAPVVDFAANLVQALRGRENEHGGKQSVFKRIADLWSVELGIDISPSRAARLMCLFKLARLSQNSGNYDTWLDIAGYAACGAELAAQENKRSGEINETGETNELR